MVEYFQAFIFLFGLVGLAIFALMGLGLLWGTIALAGETLLTRLNAWLDTL